MKISFAKPGLPTEGALVVGVFADKALSATAKQVDEATDGALSRAMTASRFEGKPDQTVTLLAPAGMKVSRVVAVGLGEPAKLDEKRWQSFGGAAASAASGDESVVIAVDLPEKNGADAGEAAAHAAFGALTKTYRFDKYRTTEKKEDKPQLKKAVVHVDDQAKAKKLYDDLEAVAQGVALCRDLVNEPANVLGPVEFAAECRKLETLGVKVTVLGEKEMKKLGMGALLGVGQGSARESQLAVMEWNGGKQKDAPLALVGKGVCFDTGGISIKPAAGMEEMKGDMGGGAAVIGAMKALALRKAKANVVGLIGLVENMPSGTAQRPGDVVTSMSGQTIEVLNTDAEGRLVLADVLAYAQQQFKPKAVVDLATLTGAIVISLGSDHAGLFSNDDALAAAITEAGTRTGDKVWRMPLGDAYDKQIKSEIADMKNIGGREAGSITAAQFLQRFIKDTPWAHIDIAGTAWTKGMGTGFGVKLLDRLVRDTYEAKS